MNRGIVRFRSVVLTFRQGKVHKEYVKQEVNFQIIIVRQNFKQKIKMCILKLLRLHIIQKHRRQKSTNFRNTSDFYTFQRMPFRSHFAFPDFVTVNSEDEMEELETITSSLLESKCSDFIFRGNICNCRNFHEELKENEDRYDIFITFLNICFNFPTTLLSLFISRNTNVFSRYILKRIKSFNIENKKKVNR